MRTLIAKMILSVARFFGWLSRQIQPEDIYVTEIANMMEPDFIEYEVVVVPEGLRVNLDPKKVPQEARVKGEQVVDLTTFRRSSTAKPRDIEFNNGDKIKVKRDEGNFSAKPRGRNCAYCADQEVPNPYCQVCEGTGQVPPPLPRTTPNNNALQNMVRAGNVLSDPE